MFMKGIGIDIGGTNTKIIVTDEKGKIISTFRFSTEAKKGPESFICKLSEAVKKISSTLDEKPAAIGIGSAGDVDPKEGIIRYSPNLNWRNVHLAEILSQNTGLPCVMENDANMAAWGAYVTELNKEPNCTVLALTMGTGIGSGIIIDGKLFHGSTGSAGEAGHIVLERGGRLCNCGKRGCFEAYCGSIGILKRASELITDTEAFVKKYNPNGIFDTYTLTKADDAGDPIAKKIWQETGRYMGWEMADLILLFNPNYIVITGGVSKARAKFMPALLEEFKNQSISTPFSKVKIIASDNPELGSIGSALFGLEHINN